MATPILVDTTIDGKATKAAVVANRNGFFYAIDRRDGHFLYAIPLVENINWTTGLDPKTGKPTINEAMKPLANGKRWRRSFLVSRAAPTGFRPPTIRRPEFSSSPSISGGWASPHGKRESCNISPATYIRASTTKCTAWAKRVLAPRLTQADRRERNARHGDRQGDRKLRGRRHAAHRTLADMGAFNQALIDAGLFVDAGGVKESRKGARVAFSGKDRTVTKGPFSNISELAAGYWIWRVKNLDEAIDGSNVVNPMPGPSVIEIRQFRDEGFR